MASLINEDALIKWKWVTIVLHMALYSFCICALTGTNSGRVLRKPNRRGRPWLISFEDAVKRIKQPKWMNQYTNSKPVILSNGQNKSINRLSENRNQFEHYEPLYWSIEVSGMPDIIRDVIDVIEELVFECGNVSLDDAQEERVRRAIDGIRSHVSC